MIIIEGVDQSGRGFYEKALISFRAALALRPRNARALFHLGNAQFALQAYADAERSFETALKVCLLYLHFPYFISDLCMFWKAGNMLRG